MARQRPEERHLRGGYRRLDAPSPQWGDGERVHDNAQAEGDSHAKVEGPSVAEG